MFLVGNFCIIPTCIDSGRGRIVHVPYNRNMIFNIIKRNHNITISVFYFLLLFYFTLREI